MNTVFVGLSGGVDSAVSAALLKEKGYNVVGAFIKIWQPEFIECTWREDRLDAMRVCATLQIPYKEIDLSEEYKREVIADMIEGYREGRTPNPDVLCNRSIKFGSFAKWAFDSGADAIATGHYAQIKKHDDEHHLVRGVDGAKDQSYFLWQLTSEDLARTFFPVGGYEKQYVRTLATNYRLPVSRKHDSQGLCFVGDITLPEFLARYIHVAEGDVLDKSGTIIGKHSGAPLYTKGQRHGFTLFQNSEHAPHFVTETDIERNTITVSSQSHRAATSHIRVDDVSWVNHEPDFPFSSHVQVRYREKAHRAKTERAQNDYVIHFESPHTMAAGQSLVWYADDRVLGGGICRG
jgi:tRNA-specific 2-thiouridylase